MAFSFLNIPQRKSEELFTQAILAIQSSAAISQRPNLASLVFRNKFSEKQHQLFFIQGPCLKLWNNLTWNVIRFFAQNICPPLNYLPENYREGVLCKHVHTGFGDLAVYQLENGKKFRKNEIHKSEILEARELEKIEIKLLWKFFPKTPTGTQTVVNWSSVN